MSLASILGQLLEQGISGQSQTQARIGTTARNMSQGGQGFEQVLGSLQSMLGGAAARPQCRVVPARDHGSAGGLSPEAVAPSWITPRAARPPRA